MKNWILAFSLCLSFSTGVAVAEPAAPVYQNKIAIREVVTQLPASAIDFFGRSFNSEAWSGWALLVASSAVTYHYDEDLYLGSRNTGRRWGLAQEDHTKTVWKAGQYDLLRLPSDKASLLYFMGDGWTNAVVASAFLANGYFFNNVRPYNTAFQMAHGMILSTVIAQFIKRATGRESPSDRTDPRGAWRPFPEPRHYDANTSKYDAMPSGHIMTSTLVWEIIRGNYPEYNHLLIPAEALWLTTLGFAMMNNGVHWASDYPLGFAIGYVAAQSSLRLGRSPSSASTATRGANERPWHFVSGLSPEGVTTLNAIKYF